MGTPRNSETLPGITRNGDYLGTPGTPRHSHDGYDDYDGDDDADDDSDHDVRFSVASAEQGKSTVLNNACQRIRISRIVWERKSLWWRC